MLSNPALILRSLPARPVPARLIGVAGEVHARSTAAGAVARQWVTGLLADVPTMTPSRAAARRCSSSRT